jgi:hypothetical protein
MAVLRLSKRGFAALLARHLPKGARVSHLWDTGRLSMWRLEMASAQVAVVEVCLDT